MWNSNMTAISDRWRYEIHLNVNKVNVSRFSCCVARCFQAINVSYFVILWRALSINLDECCFNNVSPPIQKGYWSHIAPIPVKPKPWAKPFLKIHSLHPDVQGSVGVSYSLMPSLAQVLLSQGSFLLFISMFFPLLNQCTDVTCVSIDESWPHPKGQINL